MNFIGCTLILSNFFGINIVAKNTTIGTLNQSNREVWLKKRLLTIPTGRTILDAGAGELRYKVFCQHLIYVSQDFAQYDGKGDKSGLQTGTWDQTRLDIVSDITHIPQLDEAFDAVMCIEVLEHVPNPIDVIRELVRLLRSGGDLIITAPFCSLSHFTPYFFQTGYSEYFYRYWLEKMGMEIIDLQKNGDYFEYLAQELRRLPEVSRKYSGISMSRIEGLGIRVILRALERFSMEDKGSNKLLCFGIHVHARKRVNTE